MTNDTQKPKSSARLHAILARRGPNAVVFRRGPSDKVAVIGWNRSNDTSSRDFIVFRGEDDIRYIIFTE